MAVYSNPLCLFNADVKVSPIGADLVPIGDSAVAGIPLKQATIDSILALSPGGGLTTTVVTTNPFSIEANHRYIVSGAFGPTVLTLLGPFAVGDLIIIENNNIGDTRIDLAGSAYVVNLFGYQATGAANDRITITQDGSSISIVCTVADSDFLMETITGSRIEARIGGTDFFVDPLNTNDLPTYPICAVTDKSISFNTVEGLSRTNFGDLNLNYGEFVNASTQPFMERCRSYIVTYAGGVCTLTLPDLAATVDGNLGDLIVVTGSATQSNPFVVNVTTASIVGLGGAAYTSITMQELYSSITFMMIDDGVWIIKNHTGTFVGA